MPTSLNEFRSAILVYVRVTTVDVASDSRLFVLPATLLTISSLTGRWHSSDQRRIIRQLLVVPVLFPPSQQSPQKQKVTQKRKVKAKVKITKTKVKTEPHANWKNNYKIVKEVCTSLAKMVTKHRDDDGILRWSQLVGNGNGMSATCPCCRKSSTFEDLLRNSLSLERQA